jgi:hypothetical protein
MPVPARTWQQLEQKKVPFSSQIVRKMTQFPNAMALMTWLFAAATGIIFNPENAATYYSIAGQAFLEF